VVLNIQTWRYRIRPTLKIYHVGNYEEFSRTDSSLQCYNKNEDCDEEIVEQIEAKHNKTSDDQESDEDDTTERERVTDQDATVAGLRLNFMQEGNEGSPVSALETCSDFYSLAVNQQNMAGYTRSITPLSLTVMK
jgi:hypothetical protein